MHVGMLTARMRGKPFDEVVKFAGENGIRAMEVDSRPGGHLDPKAVLADGGAAVKRLLERHKVGISALAYFANMIEPDPKKREEAIAGMKQCIDAAKVLGVGVITTHAGFPMPGKDKYKTIEQDCPGVFKPIAQYAGERGVKLANEIWFATNLQNLEHFKLFFQVIPDPAIGLNYDPSHLYWQGIDLILGVDEFGKRIYHTHGKDCEVKQHVLRRVGSQDLRGWWRYVIPGFGNIAWGEYIGALRRVGYDGVISIEHEDAAVGAELGFIKGKQYLELFM